MRRDVYRRLFKTVNTILPKKTTTAANLRAVRLDTSNDACDDDGWCVTEFPEPAEREAFQF
tara:strand:- start:224111 stop:224293 length:183 start_codon:yes stop_codon:yes gene_type:complete